ncbi:MAG: type IV toxin-antitoxin system AbiEi family antitoxin [Oligoflexia bacterium]|nr:type IV toxin-antitoxin system AbiEi family antitoxin [Oligoflexia bacterium]
MKHFETNLLETAIRKLEAITDLQVHIQAKNVLLGKGKNFDALISIGAKEGEHYPFVVDIKKHITDLGPVSSFIKSVPEGLIPMIVAERISAEVIQYLDREGICFLSLEDGQARYVTATSNRHRYIESDRIISGEATARLIFAVLNQPDVLFLSQRELARVAGISLGTTNNGLKDLAAINYILETKNGYILNPETLERLIDYWATMYIEKVRPKYFAGLYRQLNNKETIVSLRSDRTIALLGGELAVADLLKNTRGDGSAKLLYYQGELVDVIKNMKLVRDDRAQNPIQIYEAAWFIDRISNGNLVPPLIIYADLIFLRSSRMQEIAKTVLKEKILPRLHGLNDKRNT